MKVANKGYAFGGAVGRARALVVREWRRATGITAGNIYNNIMRTGGPVGAGGSAWLSTSLEVVITAEGATAKEIWSHEP